MTILYQTEAELSPEEFVAVLARTSLGVRRPLAEPERIRTMLREADLIVTARDGQRLVGVSRAITDYSFCTYLSDLAVDEEYQGQGIGRELIQRTHQLAGLKMMLVLLAAPAAETYYPHIGMQQHHSCWIIPRKSQ